LNTDPGGNYYDSGDSGDPNRVAAGGTNGVSDGSTVDAGAVSADSSWGTDPTSGAGSVGIKDPAVAPKIDPDAVLREAQLKIAADGSKASLLEDLKPLLLLGGVVTAGVAIGVGGACIWNNSHPFDKIICPFDPNWRWPWDGSNVNAVNFSGITKGIIGIGIGTVVAEDGKRAVKSFEDLARVLGYDPEPEKEKETGLGGSGGDKGNGDVGTSSCDTSEDASVSGNFWRGGKDMTLKNGEANIDPKTGRTPADGASSGRVSHGPSLFSSINKITSKGFTPYKVAKLPKGLKIVQRGKDSEHYEIVPECPIDEKEFQKLLNDVTLE
jgi:hypothetical protein